MTLPILFEDAEALIVDKPAGLPVNAPRAGGDSLAERLPDLAFGFLRPPTPVHRLDRDTSGCLLLARNPKALRRFAAAFEAREVQKRYLAIVAGDVAAAAGTIDLALAKVSTAEEGWRIVPDPRGKRAVTHWRRIATAGGRTLLLLTPETGRTHQLRVHAAAGLGRAIVGDPVYGEGGRAGMMLHAWTLSVARAGKPAVAATAPLPARFLQAGFSEAELPAV